MQIFSQGCVCFMGGLSSLDFTKSLKLSTDVVHCLHCTWLSNSDNHVLYLAE